MPSLTYDEAVARAALIAVTSYTVDLDLTSGDDETAPTYRSYTVIRFTCRRPGEGTFADLHATEVVSMRLNGRPLPPEAWTAGRLTLDDLAADNVLVVEAQMPWRRDGQGLHRAFDPADGAAYVFGHFFLDAAPSVTVCFDQPDLKAPWTVSVSTPRAWQVIGNGVSAPTSLGRFELTPTAALSTYFVTVCAGPYVSVRGHHDGIPLAVHARASLRAELERDASRLLEVTGIFLDAFHDLFGIRYPFGGYDQVFVPEFNALAMENPGCVVLRDELLFRGRATDDEILRRDNTIAHEMAHMWFGDLVTMQWWDDLWLNESFAEYLAARVLVSTGVHPDAWVNVTMERRPWGYAAERAPSTHPVAGRPAVDAMTALHDFDGISYAKGAAALRQLIEYVGDDAFVAGVRAHLTRHAFGNATMADFLGAIAAASGRDLGPWGDGWLMTAGRDTLSARIRDTSLEVVRRQPVAAEVPAVVDCSAQRPHSTDVAGYAEGAEVFRVSVTLGAEPVVVPLPDAEIAAVGARARVVIPNASDLTWAAVDLDPDTIAALPDELPRIVDAQVRASVWVAVLDAVARGALTPIAYVDLFCAAWGVEEETAILSPVADRIAKVIRAFIPGDLQEVQLARVADTAAAALREAVPGSGRALAAARVVAALSADIRLLREWALGLGLPAGLAGDSDFLWIVVENLAARGELSAADLERFAHDDQTLQGRLNSLKARASLPDAAAKEWAWEQLTSREADHSNYELNYLASGFWRAPDETDLRPYVERFFDVVPTLHEWIGEDALSTVVLTAFPEVVEERTLELSAQTLTRTDLTPATRRALVDGDWALREALVSRRRFFLADPA